MYRGVGRGRVAEDYREDVAKHLDGGVVVPLCHCNHGKISAFMFDGHGSMIESSMQRMIAMMRIHIGRNKIVGKSCGKIFK